MAARRGCEDRLCELRIAFKFDCVRSSLPDAAGILGELERRFGVSTKYFLGATEIAYTLAVNRVDDAIKSRMEIDNDEPCVIKDFCPPLAGGARPAVSCAA